MSRSDGEFNVKIIGRDSYGRNYVTPEKVLVLYVKMLSFKIL